MAGGRVCLHLFYGVSVTGPGMWWHRVNASAVRCGVAAARELVRVKDELCWYKSARFWQFAATAAAYGQEVDFDLRVDHVGRLQWRHPITSSAQFVCHIYTEFMARSHLSFVSAIVYRKHTHTHKSKPVAAHTHTHTPLTYYDNRDSHTGTYTCALHRDTLRVLPVHRKTAILSFEHYIS